jgi:WD repeat-containing protein 1 (actin-interacting protein 1)
VIEGHRGAVTCLEYSPDGVHLAAGDAAREVNVWTRGGDWSAKIQGLWQFHTSTIYCLAWCPDSRYVCVTLNTYTAQSMCLVCVAGVL